MGYQGDTYESSSLTNFFALSVVSKFPRSVFSDLELKSAMCNWENYMTRRIRFQKGKSDFDLQEIEETIVKKEVGCLIS